MDTLAEWLAPLTNQHSSIYIVASMLIMLVVIFFMHRTYRASLNVEARLAEFSSLTGSVFGNKLRLIEASADAYQINRKALGPLARIIDEYCVLTTDPQGIITYANDRFTSFSGQSLQALVGRHQRESGLHTLSSEAAGELRATLAQERVWHGQLCLRTRDGTQRWLDTFVFPLSFVTDLDAGCIYFGTDITALRTLNDSLRRQVRTQEAHLNRAEDMLVKSEKMASLGVISAGIAHEINNPLAYVSANVNRLGEYLTSLSARADTRTARDDELRYILGDYPALLQETRDGIARIRKIINDLNSFSHEGDLPHAAVDVHGCIDTALSLARHELQGDVQVHTDLAATHAIVNGSATQLAQVFLNLLVNAAQAIRAGGAPGQIKVSSLNEGTRLIIEVRDTGPGLTADALATLFEPFYTTKAIGEGTGLGLAISDDIVRRHQGDLRASNNPEGGACFQLLLPTTLVEPTHAH